MATMTTTTAGVDAALATALAAAQDALKQIKNGPLGDATSELCWTCNAAAACSVDDARKKIAAAMDDLRDALRSAAAGVEDPPPRKRAFLSRGALGFADE